MESQIHKMLPFGCGEYKCRAASFRGHLKHSHLENTYLDSKRTPRDLIGVLNESKDGKVFHQSTRELFEVLVLHLEDDYNPLSLQSKFPLIADVLGLEERYFTEFDPQKRIAALRELGVKFFEALDIYLRSDPHSQEATFAEMLVSARALHAELSTLPKGVWLP